MQVPERVHPNKDNLVVTDVCPPRQTHGTTKHTTSARFLPTHPAGPLLTKDRQGRQEIQGAGGQHWGVCKAQNRRQLLKQPQYAQRGLDAKYLKPRHLRNSTARATGSAPASELRSSLTNWRLIMFPVLHPVG